MIDGRHHTRSVGAIRNIRTATTDSAVARIIEIAIVVDGAPPSAAHRRRIGGGGRIGGDRTLALSDLVEELKRSSSRWMKGRGIRSFYWQVGYGGFSFGQTDLARIVTYIHNQERHHRALTFEAEYLRLLDRYEVEYDPRYLWD